MLVAKILFNIVVSTKNSQVHDNRYLQLHDSAQAAQIRTNEDHCPQGNDTWVAVHLRIIITDHRDLHKS